MYAISILTAITGLVTYQLAMRAAPREVNPWWLLAIAYAIAAALCVPAGYLWRAWIAPAEPTPTSAVLLPAAAIAVTVILIEIGYLWVYRAGWSMAVAPAVAQAATLALLAVIGLAVLGEKFTLPRAVGLAMCVVGVLLVVRKG